MAMIDCPECEKPISDKAPSCPHCGIVFESHVSPEPPTVRIVTSKLIEDTATEKVHQTIWAAWQTWKKIMLFIVAIPIIGGAIGVVVGGPVYVVFEYTSLSDQTLNKIPIIITIAIMVCIYIIVYII